DGRGRGGGAARPGRDLGALPRPVGGEGWGEGATGPSTHFPLRDLNPSPHPSPYGRGSTPSRPRVLLQHDGSLTIPFSGKRNPRRKARYGGRRPDRRRRNVRRPGC